MTIFSFGAGQESIYLLYRIIFDKAFREKHIIGRLIVIGSDTGCEHPHTYAAVELAKKVCKENNIEFYWVTPDMGYHPNTWQSLQSQYKKNCTIGSAAYQQTCTDNLKVKVVNNFGEAWLKKTYNIHTDRKVAYREFVETHNGGNKIRLILGYAKGEEKRIKKGDSNDPTWKRHTMERYYPLMLDGIDRQQCIDYNEKQLTQRIYPSNCMMCFYQSDQEILWLYRNQPEVFEEWERLEAAKLKKYEGIADKNFGVYGKLTLREKLYKAINLYGDWTAEQLDEYKYSHGHCIKSKY